MLEKCTMGSSTGHCCCLQGSLMLSAPCWWLYCRRTSTGAWGPLLILWVLFFTCSYWLKRMVSHIGMNTEFGTFIGTNPIPALIRRIWFTWNQTVLHISIWTHACVCKILFPCRVACTTLLLLVLRSQTHWQCTCLLEFLMAPPYQPNCTLWFHLKIYTIDMLCQARFSSGSGQIHWC